MMEVVLWALGVLIPLLVASVSLRRRTAVWRAVRAATSGNATLREAIRRASSELSPSAPSADFLATQLRDSGGADLDSATIAPFLRRLHREYVERGLEPRWQPPATLPNQPSALIHGAYELVGRDDELHLVREALAEGRNVAISGPPGIGKSLLLDHLMATSNRPVVYVRLELGGSPMRDLRLALHRLLHGPFPIDDDEGIDLVRRAVPVGQLLFVDNADTDDSSHAVCRVANHIPWVRIVATTRAADFPGFQKIELRPLDGIAAGELVRAIGVTDIETAKLIIDRGRGVPQLIRQAAWAAEQGMDPGTGLGGRLTGLAAQVDRAAPRFIAALGDLPAGVHPIEVVEALGVDAVTFEVLSRNAVLRTEAGLCTVHATFLEAVRTLPRQRAVTAAARADAASSYSGWLRSAMDHEVDAVVSNVLFLIEKSDPERGLDLLDELILDDLDDPGGFVSRRGLGALFIKAAKGGLLSAAPHLPDQLAARVLKNLGIFAQRIDSPDYEEFLAKAKALYGASRDTLGVAACTWMLGAVADDASRYADAERLYREPLGILDDANALATSHHLVGCTLYHQGRLKEAAASYERARSIGSGRSLESRLARRCAYLTLAEGRADDALVELQVALEHAEELKQPRNIARICRHIGMAHTMVGRLDEADFWLLRSEEGFLAVGDKRGLGGAAREIGHLRRLQRRFAESEAALGRSRDYALGDGTFDIGAPRRSVFGVAAASEQLGLLYREMDHDSMSIRCLRDAANAYEAIGHPRLATVAPLLPAGRDYPIPQPRAILFDLVDTIAQRKSDAWSQADEQMARGLAVATDQFRDAWRRTRRRASSDVEWSTESRIRHVARELGVSPSERVVRELAELQRYLWTECIALVPGTAEAMTALRAAGVQLCVVSNGSVSMTGLASRLGLEKLASCLLSCEVGSLKPYAPVYRRALTEVGASATQAVYVGNGDDFELEGARDVGVFSVRVRVAGPPRYSLGQSYSWDACVDSVSELAERCLTE